MASAGRPFHIPTDPHLLAIQVTAMSPNSSSIALVDCAVAPSQIAVPPEEDEHERARVPFLDGAGDMVVASRPDQRRHGKAGVAP
jgi:hypothetical protein